MPAFEVPKIYPHSKEYPSFKYDITQTFDWEGDKLTTTIATQMRDASDRVVLQHYQTDFTELREFLEAKRAGLQLVAVKPGHGRLIDADALVDSFDPSDFWNPDAEDNCFAAIHVVNSAPTVIPADQEAKSP